LVAQTVAQQVTLQGEETRAAARDWVANLRQEETTNLARIARQLQYLELAQSSVWKETQRQKEVISLVARYQQPLTGSPAQPPRR